MYYKEVILMAKGMDVSKVKWFAILLLVVGLWFMAADMGWMSTYGFTMWPIVVALVGLKMIFHK